MNFIKEQLEDYKKLLRSIPSMTITFFILSVVVMNLLANKELVVFGHAVGDCGITISWMSFLCMDVICKRFGPKATTKISILALVINLCVCIFFNLLCRTPGSWGEFYTYEIPEINNALDSTFGGTWYVVFGSTVAMFFASITNAVINYGIGKHVENNSFKDFALRTWISTLFGQIVDNLTFALIVSKVFFGWGWTEIITSVIVGTMLELLSEMIFSPIGYKIANEWERDQVGKSYLEGVSI